MDFHSAFEEIDVDKSGSITRDELVTYTRIKKYKETFVTKWLSLFDIDGDGEITYQEYCSTLGLTPKDDYPPPRPAPVIAVVSALNFSLPPVESEVPIVQSTCTLTQTVNSSKLATPIETGKSENRLTVTKSTSNKKLPLSRGRVYRKKTLYRYTKDKKIADQSEPSAPSEQVAQVKQPRRPAHFEHNSLRRKRRLRPKKLFCRHTRRLRPSLSPGRIVILLCGRHRGKRVVVVKLLTCGFLIVTGPFKLNGVPLRLAHPKFVIATSTVVDISQIKLPDNLDAKLLRREQTNKSKKKLRGSGPLMEEKSGPYVVSQERKAAQKVVDRQILDAIQKRPGNCESKVMLQNYLSAKFGLSNNDKPHLMHF